MDNLFTAFMKEAATNPLATVLVIILIAAAIYWLIALFPKWIKAKKDIAETAHKDSVAIAEHMARANELTRLCTSVIDNNTAAISNNTKVQEVVQLTVRGSCEEVRDLRSAVDDLCRVASVDHAKIITMLQK